MYFYNKCLRCFFLLVLPPIRVTPRIFFSFGLDHSIIVLNFYTYTAYLINLNLMGQKNPEDHPSLNSTKGQTHPPQGSAKGWTHPPLDTTKGMVFFPLDMPQGQTRHPLSSSKGRAQPPQGSSRDKLTIFQTQLKEGPT